MKYGKKLLFLPLISASFVICLFAYLLIPKALAQEANNYDVTVSPVFFDLTTNPGSTITERIRVRNNTSSPIPVKLEVKRLTGNEAGELTFNEENDDGSLNWISFKDDTITLAPREFTNIPFEIEVPETAAYGYYFSINLTQDSESAESTGTAISGAAAIPILLNVRKDGGKIELQLNEFNVDSFINETLPVNFEVKLENTGNVHVRPRGNIFISGMGKENITSIDVNPNGATIIPNTVRTFLSSWTDGFLVREQVMEDGEPKVDENGKPVTKLTINWNKATDIRFGKYTANLIVVYDDGTRDVPLEASKSLWIIPWKSIAIAVVAIIIIILAIRWVLRRHINREVRKRSK